MSTSPEVRNRKRLRDHAFLADRMAFWFPAYTVDQISAWLKGLSDAEYWKVFGEIFKANTIHNLTITSAMLAEHGWFLDFQFPGASAGTLGEMIDQGKLDDVNSLLEIYYDERRAHIEVELATRFPHRGRLLQACFRLHDAKDYEASVPLCLIQADGVCHDIYGVELYRIKKKAPLVRRKLDAKTVDWVWDAAATPLRNALALARPEARQSKKFNRHLILHGANLEYATKQNSLRSISLLSYLQGMAEYEQQAKSEQRCQV
jgi:hypothetical protein